MALRIEKSEEVDWEGLNFTLFLDGAIAPGKQEQLRVLILAWYTVGIYGGFGYSSPNFISDIGFESDGDQHYVEWWVDMGSLEPKALRILQRCLNRFIEVHDVKAQKLLLGVRYIE